MLSLYKLEIFAAVVQEGSFSAAAERLYMTQPAVSQHIHDLEASIGASLFVRGRRGVQLTPVAHTLYDYTQRILALVAEAESAVTVVENLREAQITIGATPGVSVYLMPEWIKAFRQRYSNLSVSIVTAVTPEIIGGVLGHKLNIGFVEGELDSSPRKGLGSMELQSIELSVVVGRGHEWCAREDLSVQDLQGQPFVTRPLNSRTRSWIDETLEAHGVRPKIVAEFDNPEAIKQAVMANLGISILPDYAIQREHGQMLRALPLRDLPLKRSLKLLWDESLPLSPVTRALLQHLSAAFPALSELVAG